MTDNNLRKYQQSADYQALPPELKQTVDDVYDAYDRKTERDGFALQAALEQTITLADELDVTPEQRGEMIVNAIERVVKKPNQK